MLSVAAAAARAPGRADRPDDRIDWILDGQFVGAGQIAGNDYYGAYFTSALAPGMHWVGARLRGHDNTILAQSNGVWFETGKAVNELPNQSYTKNPFRG